MPPTTQQTISDETYQNTTDIAVLKSKMEAMSASLVRIESNHLVHINDELRRVNDKQDANFKELTTNQLNNFRELNTAITSLKLSDASTAPGNALFWEVIKVVILGVAATALGLFMRGS